MNSYDVMVLVCVCVKATKSTIRIIWHHYIYHMTAINTHAYYAFSIYFCNQIRSLLYMLENSFTACLANYKLLDMVGQVAMKKYLRI